MGEEDALLLAMLDCPEDSTSQLAYADWLEERGDLRAGYLRVDAEIDRLAGEGRWNPALLQRRRDLEAGIDLGWLARVSRDWGSRRWRALYEDLDVRELPAEPKILPKPTDGALDRFELESGFRLPLSYRAFIKVFGPGELVFEFQFSAPGYPDQPEGSWTDLGGVNTWIKDELDDEYLLYVSDPEQLRRLVVFCGTGTGNWVGWDPADVRDARRRECGIYEWGRMDVLVKLADSFPQFIDEVCLIPDRLTRRVFAPCRDLSSLPKG